MRTITTALTVLTVVFVTLAGIPAASGRATTTDAAQAQQPTACNCDDAFLLVNRLNMDEVTVEVLKQQLQNIAASAKASGTTPMATSANQSTLRSTIKDTRETVQMDGGKSSQGETDGFCKPSIVASSTACMNEIAMLHETDVHVPACQADRRAGKTTLIGARAEQTMEDYAKEEIRGYQREIDRIREILRNLGCRQGWIGYIKYEQQYKMDRSNPLPASPARVSGSESHKYESTYTAKILFNELKPSVYNYTIADVYQWKSNSTMKTSCTGGLRQTPPNQQVTTTLDYSQKYDWVVAKTVMVNFDYDAVTGDWSLEFDLAPENANGTFASVETASGNCDPKADGTKNASAPITKSFPNLRVSRRGTAAKNLDRIQITDQFQTGPNQPMPGGGTMSDIGTLVFTFYKR